MMTQELEPESTHVNRAGAVQNFPGSTLQWPGGLRRAGTGAPMLSLAGGKAAAAVRSNDDDMRDLA